MSRFVLLAALFLAFGAVVHVSALLPILFGDDEDTDVAEWTYRRTATGGGQPYGPSNWFQGFPDCGGSAQSPINLAASTHTVAESTQFDLQFFPHTCAANELFFIANERVWEVVFNGCSEQATLSFNSEIYNLFQIHIHSPSEHAIGGSLRAAEIHWVHVKAETEDELLVVGVLFDVSEYGTNVELQPLWDVLDSGEDSTNASFETRIYDLIPPNKVFSHYTGSLTTPPCTEGVTWIVMNEATIISKMQLDEFRESVALFDDSKVDEHGNTNRPYQPLNGRDVFLVKA
ncbi:unnamed protein product [Ascophyllum nodosum]